MPIKELADSWMKYFSIDPETKDVSRFRYYMEGYLDLLLSPSGEPFWARYLVERLGLMSCKSVSKLEKFASKDILFKVGFKSVRTWNSKFTCLSELKSYVVELIPVRF